MATLTFVFFAVTLLVAVSIAAPQNSKVSIKLPEGCKEQGFCSIKPEGYDEIEEKINKLLPPYLFANVAHRAGSSSTILVPETDKDNCPSEVVLHTPFTHTYAPAKMDILVNTEKFQQNIQEVICLYNEMEFNGDGPQCFKKLKRSNFHMTFRCQQSVATRSLLVYDTDAGQLKSKNFTIPVCCSCEVIRRDLL